MLCCVFVLVMLNYVILCYVVICCVLIQETAEPKRLSAASAKYQAAPLVEEPASWFFLGHFFLLIWHLLYIITYYHQRRSQSFKDIKCYAMLCYIILCCVMLCYV